MLSPAGRWRRKMFEVLVRMMEGSSLPESLMSEPPKKLPKPTPKVVSARPVTFWLARSVTVRKQYSRPISRLPSRQHSSGIRMAGAALMSAAVLPAS